MLQILIVRNTAASLYWQCMIDKSVLKKSEMKSKGKPENSNKDAFALDLFNVGDEESSQCFLFLTFQFHPWYLCQLNVWNVNVCEAREGFLVPCNYFPFSPFSISSAVSQTICAALYKFHATQHCTPSKRSFRKPLRVEGGVGSTWSQRTQPHIWQLLSPEAPALCLWTPHK